MAQVLARTGYWPDGIPFDLDDLYTVADELRNA